MTVLTDDSTVKQKYHMKAQTLKSSILQHFYDHSTGIYHLDPRASSSGICQDVKAHAMTLDLVPHHTDDVNHLTDPGSELPRAFRGLGHWDVADVVSPYATGYAVEALFYRDRGAEAVKLIERVWGPMADTTSPNYSGGHWEAMKPDETPHGHDTSLMHGWSTWPVSLMPRYLAGLQPIEPGWKSFSVAPVLAGLKEVKCVLETAAGTVGVQLEIDETDGHGTLKILAPQSTRARLVAPQGWVIDEAQVVEGVGVWQTFTLSAASKYQDLVSKEMEVQQVRSLDPSSCTYKAQNSGLPGRIRSFLARFKTIRA